MTLLYLLRHGEIEWPEADGFIGQTDAPLSARGRRQAHAWNHELGRTAVTGIWSSDLRRATETAAIVFAGRNLVARSCRDLREINLGEWDGLPRRRVREGRPDLWQARGQDLAGFRPPGGESFSDLQERVVRCVQQIAAAATGPVCLVTHVGVIRVLMCHGLQMPLSNLFRIRLDYGSLSLAAYAPDRFEVCALNLKPPILGGSACEQLGGSHDPAQV
jgi:probable phosphoglycerate mutase